MRHRIFRMLLLTALIVPFSSNSNESPLFYDVSKEDPMFISVVLEARKHLGHFRELLKNDNTDSFKLIKKYVKNGNEGVYLWFIVHKIKKSSFIATAFEGHPAIPHIKVGNKYEIKDNEIVDWYINRNNVLQGGYTMRFHRSKLSEKEKINYDKHVGVATYAPLP